jgi:organic radical activating enzyme
MQTKLNKNTRCFNLDHALRFDNNGTASSCCMMRDVSRMTDKGKSIVELFKKDELEAVRKAVDLGIKHPACTLCWQEESAGRQSKRLRDNDKYDRDIAAGITHTDITSMELNLGNTCNIKCRTCNPTVSTTWAKEGYDVYDHVNHKTFESFTASISVFHDSYHDDSPFWADLEAQLPTLRTMVFYGGEPLLSKKMWRVLEVAVEKGYAKNISLEYNTNGTVWHAATEVWKDFKKVNLSFSIDGTHDQFGYMRFPAEWDKVTGNMEKARAFKLKYNNMNYGWCTTLSPLNIFYVKEIVAENYNHFKDFGVYLNLIHGPEYYNINQLPEEYKQVVISKLLSIPDEHNVHHYLPGIVDFIRNGKSNPAVWQTFLDTTALHDSYRVQSYSKIFPEFAEIIGYTHE